VTVLRPATRADVPAVVAMGRRFRAASRYRDVIADDPAALEALAVRLVEGPGSVLLVADRAGTLLGMIGLLAYPHHLSGERTVGEVVWWRDPAAAEALGLRLLRAAERWATEAGATLLQMIAPDDRVETLYARLGYQRLEVAYVKHLTVPAVENSIPVVEFSAG
jgi:GNAT superfamily N-acetyltransferase